MCLWFPNKTFRTTIVILMISVTGCMAQSWDVSIGAGIASYSLDELKEYQEYIRREFIAEATVAENFPSYVTYSIGVNKQFEKFILGFEGVHGSTGGRLYYEDYSGKFVADQLVKYNQLGLLASRIFLDKNNFQIAGGMKLSIVMYTLDVRNSLTIGTETLEENQTFVSKSIGFQPYGMATKTFGSFFLRVSLGFEFQTSSEPKTKDDDKLFLAGKGNEPVLLQGNGVRLALGAGFRF